MPYIYSFELLGVAVASIGGVLASRGKEVDLFGVVVLALVTALGGGTIRDLVLGDTPVFWIRDSNYLLTAACVAVAMFFVARFHEFHGTAFLVVDAVQLAFFTMIGAQKALAHSSGAAVAVALGVVTGVAGGILRDTLHGEVPLVFRPHIYLYATAALAGALVFAWLEKWAPGARGNFFAGAGLTLFLRLAAIRWKLKLPVFKPRATDL
jgi:uncharacterized membrane protein YeiH